MSTYSFTKSRTERLLNPSSIAIVGMSGRPGSIGRTLLTALEQDGFADVHLVGRSGGEIEGRPVLSAVSDLPPGIDLALLALPAGAVLDAVKDCAKHQVGAVLIYASGFAETSEEGKALQAEIAAVAAEAGMAVAGPNCIGNTNFVTGVNTVFLPQPETPVLTSGTTNALAVLAQSGGLMGLMTEGLRARDIPISYRVSTGNEAVLTLADYLDHLTDDSFTAGVMVYAEEIRNPEQFLAAVRRAKTAGTFVVVIQSGRTERGQQAVSSHTGALAADYAMMKVLLTEAGACVVESLEELLDVAETLVRYPEPVVGGIGVSTNSGAFCAIALDVLDTLDVEVPPLSPEVEAGLSENLPDYMNAANPLDMGTGDPRLYRTGIAALLSDPGIGAVVMGLPMAPPARLAEVLADIGEEVVSQSKPVLIGLLCDLQELPAEVRAVAHRYGLVLGNSPERLLRAAAVVVHHARQGATVWAEHEPLPQDALPALAQGPQAEWKGKQVLSALGISVPAGGLATTEAEAVATAASIGYPVVAKLQAPDLQHKTEAGAVLVGIADEDELRAAWTELGARAATAGVTAVDGILVEEMAAPALELVIGARRDPQWGPIILAGLGGIWIEALGDVCLIPPRMTEDDIIDSLRSLRAAKLFDGFRGEPAVDLGLVTRAVAAVQRLMLSRPDIVELDINPVRVGPNGLVALDALVVCESEASA